MNVVLSVRARLCLMTHTLTRYALGVCNVNVTAA